MTPRFSIIVLFDRDQPEPCLASLLAQTGPSFEIIAVVNHGAALPSAPNLRVIAEPDHNPARRRNRAAALAGGEILAFLDDDAAAPADWLAKADRLFQKQPELAGLGGPNLAPPDSSAREWLSDVILTTPYLGSGNPSYSSRGPARPARPGDLHLCNFLVRRESFQHLHGFNEALGYGAEDSEFIYLGQRRHGFRFGFFPELEVTHRRRPFGAAYLRQRFRLRRQNGRLLWVYPDMYNDNPTLLAALLLVPAFLISVWLQPVSLWLWAFLYAAGVWTLSFPRAKERPWALPLMPFIFLMHHLVYAFGLSYGWLAGLLQGPGRLRRLLGRPSRS